MNPHLKLHIYIVFGYTHIMSDGTHIQTTPEGRLARFTLEHLHGKPVDRHDAISALDLVLYLGSDAADSLDRDARRNIGLPTDDDVTSADALDGLAIIPDERERLNWSERRFIEAYMDRGGTWPAGADALGYPSGGALRARYRRLGGSGTWPAGRPHTKQATDGQRDYLDTDLTCDDSNEIGGAGCVLLVDHPGDHETAEGATWPRLSEVDCPKCGALMYTAQPHRADLVCAACQEDRAGGAL